MPNEITFDEIVVKSESIPKLEVCLHWDCQEGWCEEYNPDDPDDEPLLRFDVMYKRNVEDNGSYCTQLKATDNRELLTRAAAAILKEAGDCFDGKGFSGGFKKTMEWLSWIRIKDGKII